MVDVVSAEVRSRMMAGIRGTNTRPERFLRSELHLRGFRFRLHAKKLPGKPDLVFPKWRAVLFAHGCFWHGHGCHLFKWPKTREVFWRSKIQTNKRVDSRTMDALIASGWRVGIVWECALKGRSRMRPEDAVRRCAKWLTSRRVRFELRGSE